MEEGLCESCSAKIIFVTDQDGTKHPLNKRRVRVYFQTGRGWRFETDGDDARLYHISHYTTCPHPERHSKKGK